MNSITDITLYPPTGDDIEFKDVADANGFDRRIYFHKKLKTGEVVRVVSNLPYLMSIKSEEG